MPVISASWEAEIRRIIVQSQPRQEDPISTNKPGMEVCACGPRHTGGIGRRVAV
jgi:hypothetical protein